MSDEILAAQHHPDCYPSTVSEALSFFRKALALKDKSQIDDLPGAPILPGIISPHIDFRVSLAAYAAAFRPLLQIPLAENYIILGVGHRSPLEWNLDRRDYVSPLGRTGCRRDWVDRLATGVSPRRLFAPEAHDGEHSIEFALLWLQAIHALHPLRKKVSFRFLPVLCGGLHSYLEGMVEWNGMADFRRLSGSLGEIMRGNDLGGRTRIIVSIDGCHLGPRFRHPFQVTPALLKATAGWEEMLWACAAKGDARTLLDWFRKEGNDRYFDGVGALALLLAAGEGNLRVQRTYYEQWFTERDASAVTFSSGLVPA